MVDQLHSEQQADDPARHEAVIYELGADHRYHRRPLDEAGRVTSAVLTGFALDPALLWRDEPPAGEALVKLVQGMLDAVDH